MVQWNSGDWENTSRGYREDTGLNPSVFSKAVQQNPRENRANPGVRIRVPHRQERIPQDGQGHLESGGHPHEHTRQDRPRQGQDHRCEARPPAPLPQPVHALENHHQNGKAGHHAVHGIEAVGPDRNKTGHHQKQQSGHQQVNKIYFYKVFSPVMGVGEALCQAEQKQRRGQPSRHAEPLRHPARVGKHIVDVVQDHQHQGNPFQLRGTESLCPYKLHKKVSSQMYYSIGTII